MEITWLGHSCVRIQGSHIAVVTDPYSSSSGATLPKVKADVITVSHEHPDHSNVTAVDGSPRILAGPGEYEVANFYISGMGTPRHAKLERSDEDTELTEDSPEISDANFNKQINTIYTYRSEGLTLCHLGSIIQPLTSRQLENLNQTDILFIPVGGNSTIPIDRAAQLLNLIGPRIVVPINYQSGGANSAAQPVDNFLQEIGATEVNSQTKLSVTATNLPRDMTVIVLEQS